LYAQKLATRFVPCGLWEIPEAFADIAHEYDRFHAVNVQNSRHFVENFVHIKVRLAIINAKMRENMYDHFRTAPAMRMEKAESAR